MQYRTLGKTGLKVSALGFGGSSLGGAFKEINEADGIRAVHVAVDNGINLIDTSPFYGLTKAETALGKALREIPREKYLLATKVGRYGYKQKDFNFSAARVTASVDESLRRLGVDYVDFIQAHDMEFGDVEQIVHEAIPALRKVQTAGKARFIGITALPPKLLRTVMERAEVDQIQSYCHYCLNDTALADALPFFKSRGVAIFNSAPLAMRLLSLEGPPHWHPAPPEVRAKCAEAARFCQSRGADIGKLALQFAVAHPDIHTNIVGSADPVRMLKNIRDIEEPLDEELLAQVLEILKPIHNVTWPSGRPENN
jgi:L-galactose dehydrogenase